MRIFYNVTGEKRKALVGTMSEELKQPVHYLGAPTFSYEVGGYRVDKVGTLEGADDRELVADLCGLHDFRAETEEYDTPVPEPVPIPDELPIPYEAEVGGRVSPYRDEEEPQAYDSPDTDQPKPDRLTIEMPLDGFSDTVLTNLRKMVASKAALVRKALGTDDLPIERTADRLLFPWFQPTTNGEILDAYARFVVALCAAAKAQKRVTAREKPVENEKFALRVFLVRLGMVGDDYKYARRILLKNLTGNSAFRDGRPKKTEVASDD